MSDLLSATDALIVECEAPEDIPREVITALQKILERNDTLVNSPSRRVSIDKTIELLKAHGYNYGRYKLREIVKTHFNRSWGRG
jgi:hypothetical protein